MKFKDIFEHFVGFLLVFLVLVILFPFLVLYLLYKLFMTPFAYIKHKRSLYQKDFPCQYSWWSFPHVDSKIYTIIKENCLPITYIKWGTEYDWRGYFVYKDILLVFEEPFFYDKKRGLWLIWLGQDSDEETIDDDEDDENTEDCLTIDEGKANLLEIFHRNVPDRVCHRVVLFYSRKSVEKNYEEGGLEKMRELDDFILYEKGELASAIKHFVENN